LSITTGSDDPPAAHVAAPMPTSVAEFIAALRALKVQAGNPSFEDLRRRSGIPRRPSAQEKTSSSDICAPFCTLFAVKSSWT
jgi:hypothetical protein